jgi:hypothetical protein
VGVKHSSQCYLGTVEVPAKNGKETHNYTMLGKWTRLKGVKRGTATGVCCEEINETDLYQYYSN